MKRSSVLTSAAIAAFAALAPVASADVVELGGPLSPLITKSPFSPLTSPTCPPTIKPVDCTIVLTRTTALQTITNSVAYPTAVTQAGWIVAFRIGLSGLSTDRTTAKTDIHNLDSAYGGTTQAAIVVLSPGKRLKHCSGYCAGAWKVTAISPVFHLQPYLGTVAQFPFVFSGGKDLPVARGDVIGLSVPTWVPVLSFGLNTKQYAYRQSRTTGCPTPATTQTAQLTDGASMRYVCNYPGTRVEYSATEITTPPTAKNPIHSVRRPAASRR